MPTAPVRDIPHAVIECDPQTYIEIATKLQFAITGKPVFYSDSLVDLVKRHCPELYDLAASKGYRFAPSDDMRELEKKPPNVRFDVFSTTAS